MNNSEILNALYESDKELIIYRNSEKNNFEIYTDFAEKVNLNIGNLDKFLKKPPPSTLIEMGVMFFRLRKFLAS